MKKIVTYIRVSTARQGASGLGLEAQTAAIKQFTEQRNAHVVAEYREVESGTKSERPELIKALEHAKLTGSTLVVAKLDRLSRDPAFLLTLQQSEAKFIAADMPDANELTIGIMALIAKQERQAISDRTKAALQAAKARGIKLGNPNGIAAIKANNSHLIGSKRAGEAVASKADTYAKSLASTISDIQAAGYSSLTGIAA